MNALEQLFTNYWWIWGGISIVNIVCAVCYVALLRRYAELKGFPHKISNIDLVGVVCVSALLLGSVVTIFKLIYHALFL